MPVKYTRAQLIGLIANASALGFYRDADMYTKQLEELDNKEKN